MRFSKFEKSDVFDAATGQSQPHSMASAECGLAAQSQASPQRPLFTGFLYILIHAKRLATAPSNTPTWKNDHFSWKIQPSIHPMLKIYVSTVPSFFKTSLPKRLYARLLLFCKWIKLHKYWFELFSIITVISSLIATILMLANAETGCQRTQNGKETQ